LVRPSIIFAQFIFSNSTIPSHEAFTPGVVGGSGVAIADQLIVFGVLWINAVNLRSGADDFHISTGGVRGLCG
jgi:hypothetical protein